MEEGGPLIHARTLMVPDGIHFLYKHLIDANQIVEIENFNKELLKIFPWNVLDYIEKGDDEQLSSLLPQVLIELIQEQKLFNYASKSSQLA